MWEGLPVTFFERLQMDASTAARCRAVCKKWQQTIDRITNLRHHVLLHHVHATNENALARAISNRNLRVVTKANATRMIDSMLWLQHDFNWFAFDRERFYSTKASYFDNTLEDMLERFGWEGEAASYFIQPDTGDVVIANNFYSYNRFEEFPSSSVEGLRWLQNVQFPGTFVWKLITFPMLRNIDAHGKTFHRGYCFCITFRKHTQESVNKTFLKKQARNTKRNPRDETEAETQMGEYLKRRKT
jgi:hypothetical protein